MSIDFDPIAFRQSEVSRYATNLQEVNPHMTRAAAIGLAEKLVPGIRDEAAFRESVENSCDPYYGG